MNAHDEERLQKLIEPYLSDSGVQMMMEHIQHGSVTTFQHCVNVSRVCWELNRRLHLKANERELLEGALLHDFFLYDWHGENSCGWAHSYRHPMTACKNAVEHFSIDEKIQNMIKCHMWPYTFWRIPKSREAWILVAADKYCSLKETLFMREKDK